MQSYHIFPPKDPDIEHLKSLISRLASSSSSPPQEKHDRGRQIELEIKISTLEHRVRELTNKIVELGTQMVYWQRIKMDICGDNCKLKKSSGSKIRINTSLESKKQNCFDKDREHPCSKSRKFRLKENNKTITVVTSMS